MVLAGIPLDPGWKQPTEETAGILSTSAEAPLRNDEAYSEANHMSTSLAGVFDKQDIFYPAKAFTLKAGVWQIRESAW